MPRLPLIAALLASTLLAACDRPSTDPAAAPAGERPDSGGVAVLAELQDINQPHPLLFETLLDANLTDMMYMSLARGAWENGRLVHLTAERSPMAIARRYEYLAPDSTAIRFHLRSDVRWSDGKPLTAADVVWTYRAIADSSVASPRAEDVAELREVVAENDSTVVFRFRRRYPEMLFHLGSPIAPKHVYEATPPASLRKHPALVNPDNGALVVSGPFVIQRWRKGQEISLRRNPHFSPRAHLDGVVIRVIPESTTRLVELQTGAVDFARPVPHDQIAALAASNPDLRFVPEEKRYSEHVAYNPASFPPFADPEIRLALGLALDVRSIIAGLGLAEYAVPAGGPYSPIVRDVYDPRTQAPLPFDTARARAILAARGWRDTDGDGVLDRDGKLFRFTLLVNTGNARRADLAQLVQAAWKRIGVDARIQQLEFNTYWSRTTERKYDAVIAGWAVPLSPDLTQLWGEESPMNYVGYRDAATSADFRAAREAATAEQANARWRSAAARITAARPYTWLYYFDQVDGVNERLRGMRIDTYGAYQNAWEWWIPADRQRGAGGGSAAAAPAPR